MSLALPWEVIERAVEHLWDHTATLYSVSLTCHQLCIRSTTLLWAHVKIRSRDHGLYLCQFLREAPHIQPLILSIAVPSACLTPSLLNSFDNVSSVTIFSPVVDISSITNVVPQKEYLSSIPGGNGECTLHLHLSSLTCYQRLATRIHTLHLLDLSFATSMGFARVLLAFCNIKHLMISQVRIRERIPTGPSGILKELLCTRLQWKALTVVGRPTQTRAVVKREAQHRGLPRDKGVNLPSSSSLADNGTSFHTNIFPVREG